jgi:ABC-type dipeptide/oligopeptide/nickel transport system ATPase component
VLTVTDLRTHFHTRDGVVRAVDGVSLTLERGEDAGRRRRKADAASRSPRCRSLRSLPPAAGRIVAGSIRFDGTELLTLTPAAMRAIRGDRISMIFQEPMSSLNPVMSVGRQIAETVALHQQLSARAALDRAIEMLDARQDPEPRRRATEFPHQLSGGMRQRVMIAIAMACTPTILIADEPTTALDVTIQAQILDLMQEMKERTGAAVMLITHDPRRHRRDRAARDRDVRGRKVEEAPVDALFAHPRHPYTRGLMTSIPRLNRAAAESESAHRAGSPRSRCRAVAHRRARRVHVRAALPARERAVPRRLSAETRSAPGHIVACWNADACRRWPVTEAPVLEVERWSSTIRCAAGFCRARSAPCRRSTASLSSSRRRDAGLVGESGCGKSTTGKAILRLVDATSGTIRSKARTSRASTARRCARGGAACR